MDLLLNFEVSCGPVGELRSPSALISHKFMLKQHKFCELS